jgi:hypothetical protein
VKLLVMCTSIEVPCIREMFDIAASGIFCSAASRWCGYLHFPVACTVINMDIPYCMASVFHQVTHKYRNPFQILSSLFLRTPPPHIPQVEPDQTTSCACSLQRPAAGQPCASPTHWQMKRRGPPRSITIMQIIKVML